MRHLNLKYIFLQKNSLPYRAALFEAIFEFNLKRPEKEGEGAMPTPISVHV